MEIDAAVLDQHKDFVGPSLTLTAESEFNQVDRKSKQKVACVASITGMPFENLSRNSRAPIDLVAVIDRSASMKPRMQFVASTISFMITQLKQNDNLGIVMYDSDVEVLLPLTKMDPEGKDQARIATKNLVTKGQTNLSGGLLQALNMLRVNKTGNDVSAVLLFTDGLANIGITKTPGIIKAVEGIVKQIETVCSVFTFGYGSDPDPEFLQAISDQANGMFYFMKSPESIPESFADCLGGLLSVVAQNICLTIEAGKHSTIIEVTTIYRTVVEQPGKIVKVYIGDLYSEERKDILCTVELDALTEAKEKDSVLEIQCNYRNVINTQSEFLKTSAVIDRPDNVAASAPVNTYVDKQRNRIIAAKAMEQALEEGKKEAYDKAQELLENAKQVIVQSSSRNDAYCQLLVRQLEDSKSEVKTKEHFHGHGKQFLSSTVTSHYQQRANVATEGYYSSKSKSVVKEGYKKSLASAPSVYQEKKDPGPNDSSNNNGNNNNNNA
eukprot:TRINITY_DN2681_c0_g1_i1.p1 TRINITY_DN2681_c0_g1~~TRINITY_DN2681_c0_g1_i1.p1  ORF type:complete len:496 (-),score=113.95 TRINITY_DN2681_c0_g1_i1:23-1510(-)